MIIAVTFYPMAWFAADHRNNSTQMTLIEKTGTMNKTSDRVLRIGHSYVASITVLRTI